MLRVLAIALALHPCGGPAGAQQLVTVVAPAFHSTHATLTLWRRSGGCWTRAAGPWAARVGHLRPCGHRPRHERLRQPPGSAAGGVAALVAAVGLAADRDRDDGTA